MKKIIPTLLLALMLAGCQGTKFGNFVATIESATTGTAGTYYHTVLYKELAMIPVPAAQVYYERDFLNMMPSLERIYDGAVLGIIYIAGGATAASTTFLGHIENGWG